MLGNFKATISANNKTFQAKFLVTPGSVITLLSKETAEQLDLLYVGPPKINAVSTISFHQSNIPPSTQTIVNSHKNTFKGTGLLKNFKLQLHIDTTKTPVQQPIRSDVFHITPEKK